MEEYFMPKKIDKIFWHWYSPTLNFKTTYIIFFLNFSLEPLLGMEA